MPKCDLIALFRNLFNLNIRISNRIRGITIYIVAANFHKNSHLAEGCF